jgi:hypothetical protein
MWSSTEHAASPAGGPKQAPIPFLGGGPRNWISSGAPIEASILSRLRNLPPTLDSKRPPKWAEVGPTSCSPAAISDGHAEVARVAPELVEHHLARRVEARAVRGHDGGGAEVVIAACSDGDSRTLGGSWFWCCCDDGIGEGSGLVVDSTLLLMARRSTRWTPRGGAGSGWAPVPTASVRRPLLLPQPEKIGTGAIVCGNGEGFGRRHRVGAGATRGNRWRRRCACGGFKKKIEARCGCVAGVENNFFTPVPRSRLLTKRKQEPILHAAAGDAQEESQGVKKSSRDSPQRISKYRKKGKIQQYLNI